MSDDAGNWADLPDPQPPAPRHPPLFGYGIARTCSRWLGENECGKDAVRHVIWDNEMENGFVCVEHLSEIGTVWSYLAVHEVGPDCAMPGSCFFADENTCRCLDGLEPAVLPVEAEEAEAVHA